MNTKITKFFNKWFLYIIFIFIILLVLCIYKIYSYEGFYTTTSIYTIINPEESKRTYSSYYSSSSETLNRSKLDSYNRGQQELIIHHNI